MYGAGMTRRGRRFARAFFAVAIGSVAVASCLPAFAAGDDDEGPGNTWSDKVSDGIKNSLNGVTSNFGWDRAPGPPAAEAPSGCPTITVLPGTEAQRVMAAGGQGNQSVRYQYSIYNVGRECSTAGGRVAVKIGADGRVLLGPVGAPGKFDVPIRVVIFNESSRKPVESKLYRVSASIPTGQAAAPFQFVSESIVVPVAAGQSAANYSIKVGIDGAGKGGGDVKPRHRKKPVESASQ